MRRRLATTQFLERFQFRDEISNNLYDSNLYGRSQGRELIPQIQIFEFIFSEYHLIIAIASFLGTSTTYISYSVPLMRRKALVA